MIDHGPYTARQAASKGLIDALRYEDQVHGRIKDQTEARRVEESILSGLHSRDRRSDAAARSGSRSWSGKAQSRAGKGTDAMGTDEGFTSGAFIKMLRGVSGDNNIAV